MTRQSGQRPEPGQSARQWYDRMPYVPLFRVPDVQLSEPATRVLGALIYGIRRRVKKWDVHGDTAREVKRGSLAGFAGVSTKSVTRAMQELIRTGLIVADKRRDKIWCVTLLQPPGTSGLPVPTVGTASPHRRDPQSPSSGLPVPRRITQSARAGEQGERVGEGQERGPDQRNLDEITALAADLFRRLRYSADRGELLWQVAALVIGRQLSQSVAVDATEAVRHAPRRVANPVGYFRRVIAEHCVRHGRSLDALLRGLPLPEGLDAWPTRSPVRRPTQLSLELTGRLPRAAATIDREAERRRQIEALARAEHADTHARDPPTGA